MVLLDRSSPVLQESADHRDRAASGKATETVVGHVQRRISCARAIGMRRGRPSRCAGYDGAIEGLTTCPLSTHVPEEASDVLQARVLERSLQDTESLAVWVRVAGSEPAV